MPPAFWAAALPGVRAEFGEAWFAGEMIHGDYAGYVAEAGLDSVTQYELWKAIWSSLDSGNLWSSTGRWAGTASWSSISCR